MVNTKLKLLYILLPLFVFKPLFADESWYQTAANLAQRMGQNLSYLSSDLERYTNIHKLVIGIRCRIKTRQGFFSGLEDQIYQ